MECNNPQLSKKFLYAKFEDRGTNSSSYIFTQNLITISYNPELKKIDTIISTLHDGNSANENK